jgi:hypothetical protein
MTSIPFTEREVAYRAYWHCVCMSRSTPWGADIDEVTAARLATVAGAQRAVERALQGPPRVLYSEADDDTLRGWRSYLAVVRAELESAT